MIDDQDTPIDTPLKRLGFSLLLASFAVVCVYLPMAFFVGRLDPGVGWAWSWPVRLCRGLLWDIPVEVLRAWPRHVVLFSEGWAAFHLFGTKRDPGIPATLQDRAIGLLWAAVLAFGLSAMVVIPACRFVLWEFGKRMPEVEIAELAGCAAWGFLWPWFVQVSAPTEKKRKAK